MPEKEGKGFSKSQEEEKGEDEKPAAVVSSRTTVTNNTNNDEGSRSGEAEAAQPVPRTGRTGAKSSSGGSGSSGIVNNNKKTEEEEELELRALKAREKAVYLSLGIGATTNIDNYCLDTPQQKNTNTTKDDDNNSADSMVMSVQKEREKAIRLSLLQFGTTTTAAAAATTTTTTTTTTDISEQETNNDNNNIDGKAAVVGKRGEILVGNKSPSKEQQAQLPIMMNSNNKKQQQQQQQQSDNTTKTALTTTSTSSAASSSSRLPACSISILPGAYSGAPGQDGLERRDSIHKSLFVGRPSMTLGEQQQQLSSSASPPSLSTRFMTRSTLNNENENAVPQQEEQQQQLLVPQDHTPHSEAAATAREGNDNIEEGDIVSLGLVEAMAVSEELIFPQNIAEPFDPTTTTTTTTKTGTRRNGITLFFCLFILLIFVVVSTFVGWKKIGTKNKNESSSSVTTDLRNVTVLTSAPTASPTGFFESLVESLPESSLENLKTFGTPQWKALHWLENHPNLPTMEEWKKQQIFALVTFFYSMEGPHWPEAIKNDWLQYETNECYWFSTGFGKFNFATGLWQEEELGGVTDDIMTPCNDRNEFQLLDLVGLELGDYNPHLPKEIALLTSLKVLSLNASHISAPLVDFLPSQLYQMTTLSTLVLGENHFNGTIPSQLGLLTNLSNLFLNSNSLSGGFPSELGQLTSLTAIGLHLNHLTGTIPLELTHLSSLWDLQLWGNSLSGTLPSEIGAMMSLEKVSLDYNSFTGTIPTTLASLSNMTHLWLTSNSLTGAPPPSLGNLVSNGVLVQVQLDNNQLTGIVAEDLCALGLNASDWYGLSFDCSPQLCGCCWCPCEGNNISAEDCPWSLPEPFDPSMEDEDWPGSFPTPINSSNTLAINIRTDQYPEETSWEWSVLEAESSLWTTLQLEEQLLEAEMVFRYTVDVQSLATYKLRLSDALEDGVCCGFGNGWFSITTAAPSAEHAEGTVIWNATGDALGATLDIILRVDSAGFAGLLDSVEEG